MQTYDVDISLIKLLNTQSSCLWFEMLWCSCDITGMTAGMFGRFQLAGIILCVGPANERGRYTVTVSLIGCRCLLQDRISTTCTASMLRNDRKKEIFLCKINSAWHSCVNLRMEAPIIGDTRNLFWITANFFWILCTSYSSIAYNTDIVYQGSFWV